MAQFVNIFDVDLKKAHAPVRLNQMIVSGNNEGNRIGARVSDDGQPVTLGGSCAGLVLRSDGTTVPITGVISGNEAYIVLDQSACEVSGDIQVAVNWVSGTSITTLLVAYGTVFLADSGAYVQPSEPIPDITELLAEIDNMREATAAAEAAATKSVRYDAVQELTDIQRVTARGNVGAAVAVATQNLIDLNAVDTTIYGVRVYTDPDSGRVDVTGSTSYARNAAISKPITLPAGTYTLSGNANLSGVFLQVRNTAGTILLQVAGISSGTLTLDTSTQIIIYAAWTAAYSGSRYAYPQLEAGSTASAFAPHWTAVDGVARAQMIDTENNIDSLKSIIDNRALIGNVDYVNAAYVQAGGYANILDLPLNRSYALVGNNGLTGYPSGSGLDTVPCHLSIIHPLPSENKAYTLYLLTSRTKAYFALRYGSDTSPSWVEIYTPYSDVNTDCVKRYENQSLFVPDTSSKVVLIGDSIVWGSGSSDYSATGDIIDGVPQDPRAENPGEPYVRRNTGALAWGAKFIALMQDEYGATAINNGAPGYGIQNIITYIDYLVPNDATDAIIMCGTNNRGAAEWVVRSNMIALLNAIKTKGVNPYVFSIITFNEEPHDPPYRTPGEIQRAIRSACETTNTPFFPLTTFWSVETDREIERSGGTITYGDYYSDALHPNNRGHRLIFRLLRELLGV